MFVADDFYAWSQLEGHDSDQASSIEVTRQARDYHSDRRSSLESSEGSLFGSDFAIFKGENREHDVDAFSDLPCHFIFAGLYVAIFSDEQSQVEDPYSEFISNETQAEFLQQTSARLFEFESDGLTVYLKNYFGPPNLAAVYRFCQSVDSQLLNGKPLLATLPASDAKTLTNRVFLLGAYMILRLSKDFISVLRSLDPVIRMVEPYRNSPPGSANFDLYVHDCWKGLLRARDAGWADFGPDGFDVHEYEELDSVLNADLHQVVPGKLLVMRSPRDLPGGALWADAPGPDGGYSGRYFSPAHYADILEQFDVQAVVRCGEPLYAREGLEGAGIAVVDLYFEDCAPPPIDVTAKFLAIAERLPGAVAVHCSEGLGRTGTLAALWLMRFAGFTAREAMGWLRVVRPGSVVGDQQRFLCAKEAVVRRPSVARPTAAPVPPWTLSDVRDVVADAENAVDTKLAAAREIVAATARSCAPGPAAPAAQSTASLTTVPALERRASLGESFGRSSVPAALTLAAVNASGGSALRRTASGSGLTVIPPKASGGAHPMDAVLKS